MTKKAKVALVRTADRKTGIPAVIDLIKIKTFAGKDVLLKPNFNTDDPFPGSTHNDTLRFLIGHLRTLGAGRITVADRSGPADTSEVIASKGVDKLCRELDADLLNFEDLPADGWVRMKPKTCTWKNGFEVARPVIDAGAVVTTCCLKTHAYGAVFTMSLKLAVGITHKRNMNELHSSGADMGRLIAEINQAYAPSLILLDAIEAFVDRGPMAGPRKRADVLLAGTDRIAIDAAGLAILKHLGSNAAVMNAKIFAQPQIRRAVELGLGVSGPDGIEFVTGDVESGDFAEKLTEILRQG